MTVTVHKTSRRRQKSAMRRWRCFLNGKDVTNRAFYADDRRGIVRMYFCHDDGPILHGSRYQMPLIPHGRRLEQSVDSVLTCERRGQVRLVRV